MDDITDNKELDNQVDNTELDINQIMQEFLDANQEVFHKLETLGKTLESVECILVPIEGRQFVKIREFDKNTLQIHHKEQPLSMIPIDFDQHVQRSIPFSVKMRTIDTRNLDPETVEQLLSSMEDLPNGNELIEDPEIEDDTNKSEGI